MTSTLTLVSLFFYSLIGFHAVIPLGVLALLQTGLFLGCHILNMRRAALFSLLCGMILILVALKIPLLSRWPVPSLLFTAIFGAYLHFNKALDFQLFPASFNFRDLRWPFLFALISVAGVGAGNVYIGFTVPDFLKIPDLPMYQLILLAIAVSAMNAFAEEFIFRGMAMIQMSDLFTPNSSNFFQAVCFGIIHYNGYPNGPWGSFLAFIFALMMGKLMQKTRSLFFPWIAHFATDLGIAVILIWLS